MKKCYLNKKIKKPGIVIYACNLNTWKFEEGGPQVQGQLE